MTARIAVLALAGAFAGGLMAAAGTQTSVASASYGVAVAADNAARDASSDAAARSQPAPEQFIGALATASLPYLTVHLAFEKTLRAIDFPDSAQADAGKFTTQLRVEIRALREFIAAPERRTLRAWLDAQPDDANLRFDLGLPQKGR